jgi:hypothetical protein
MLVAAWRPSLSSALLGVLTALFIGCIGGCLSGCVARASVGPAPSGGTAVAATVGAPPRTAPATADACKACNGIWATHGLGQSESCNCRTTDAGKRCKDGADCQGLCLAAEQPEREVVEAGPPPRGYFVGKCSDTVAIYGCFKPIDKGASKNGPVPLTEPPQSLCAD